MARPRRANCTSSWITAWVPTTSIAAPEATRATISLRALPLRLPVSQATPPWVWLTSGSSHSTSLRKCCSARISVGAIKAHCQPLSMASAAASAATTVLPEPTSPCKSLCIGFDSDTSSAISCTTRCCAPVSANGNAANSRSYKPPRTAASWGASSCARSHWAKRCDNCWASSSSNFRRCQAGWLRSSSASMRAAAGGWCSHCSASRSVGRPAGTTPAGISSCSAAWARPLATAFRR